MFSQGERVAQTGMSALRWYLRQSERRPRLKSKIRFAVAVLALLLVAGCQNVKPWQRGTLADISMRADRDPLGDAMDNHIYFSREAAEGGQSVGGGGCGCN